MFYFTCNQSKIYESFTFWNKLQEKMNFFHDIQFFFRCTCRWGWVLLGAWWISSWTVFCLNTTVIQESNHTSPCVICHFIEVDFWDYKQWLTVGWWHFWNVLWFASGSNYRVGLWSGVLLVKGGGKRGEVFLCKQLSACMCSSLEEWMSSSCIWLSPVPLQFGSCCQEKCLYSVAYGNWKDET